MKKVMIRCEKTDKYIVYGTTSWANVFRCLYLLKVLAGNVSLCSKVFVEEDQNGGEDAEQDSKSEHNEVPNTLREGSLSSEEGVLACVLGKVKRHGGDEW